jgi:predicted RNA binding protein YcfA (HicA-like mRNA interferase family)/predicted RNase H-like HicB family nuclease
MTQRRLLTAIIEREEDQYVALCPELDIASQGSSVEEVKANLTEALSLFFETADASEVARRLHTEIFITLHKLRFRLGKLRVLSGNEVCRILEQHGFVAVRQRSSHKIMQRRVADTTITVPIPLHDEA